MKNTSEPIKVRIVKCSSVIWDYRILIGSECTVEEMNSDLSKFLIIGGMYNKYGILKGDCEILSPQKDNVAIDRYTILKILDRVIDDFNKKWNSHESQESGLREYSDEIINLFSNTYSELPKVEDEKEVERLADEYIDIYEKYGCAFFCKGDDEKLKKWGNTDEQIRQIKIKSVQDHLDFHKSGIEMYMLLNNKSNKEHS